MPNCTITFAILDTNDSDAGKRKYLRGSDYGGPIKLPESLRDFNATTIDADPMNNKKESAAWAYYEIGDAKFQLKIRSTGGTPLGAVIPENDECSAYGVLTNYMGRWEWWGPSKRVEPQGMGWTQTFVIVKLDWIPEDLREKAGRNDITDSERDRLAAWVQFALKKLGKEETITYHLDGMRFHENAKPRRSHSVDLQTGMVVAARDENVGLTISARKSFRERESWTLDRTISASATAEVSAEIPGIGGASASITAGFELSAGRATELETTTELDFSASVDVPKSTHPTKVRVVYDYQEGRLQTFTSDWVASAKAASWSVPATVLLGRLRAHEGFDIQEQKPGQSGGVNSAAGGEYSLYFDVDGVYEGEAGIDVRLLFDEEEVKREGFTHSLQLNRQVLAANRESPLKKAV